MISRRGQDAALSVPRSSNGEQGTTYAVEFRGVSKHFAEYGDSKVTAVNGVNLEILEGEFFSLLGPSGCGKTTSLRMIAGFELPSEGEVYIRGQAMGATPPNKRPVNTVFQNYALFPHMTIAQNVAFGLEMDGVDKAAIARRVQEALEMVRLPGLDRRKPKQLSGGQQQRVALARSLVKRPAVLLLDEPLGALDQKLRKEMQLELKKLQREVGITFIYVTHDQEEALTMSDRIAVMDSGRVLQVGTAHDIYEMPNCRFVADFIGETSFLEGRMLEQTNRSASITLRGGTTIPALTDRTLPQGQDVIVAIRPEKMHLYGLQEHVRLPDSYVQLPGQVEEVVYIGTDTHYRVRLAGEQVVRVREQNTDPFARRLAAPGDAVTVSFAPEAARILLE